MPSQWHIKQVAGNSVTGHISIVMPSVHITFYLNTLDIYNQIHYHAMST